MKQIHDKYEPRPGIRFWLSAAVHTILIGMMVFYLLFIALDAQKTLENKDAETTTVNLTTLTEGKYQYDRK